MPIFSKNYSSTFLAATTISHSRGPPDTSSVPTPWWSTHMALRKNTAPLLALVLKSLTVMSPFESDLSSARRTLVFPCLSALVRTRTFAALSAAVLAVASEM